MNSLSNFQIPDVWEVKDAINKVRNVVLNYTEMEAKVHEATNNERWGASTTLLQEIANGTHNYQYFNEIMPTIYKRFTEKEPKQWRQIYKALVLLEYLIKNGSERVVDDARAHASVIKIMKNFYYIDDTGKDEGINIRNRAKEVVELLSNTEKIRKERQNAKKNRNKYIGVGSEPAGSKFMGFGSDSGRGISFNGDAMDFNEHMAYTSPSERYDESNDFDSFSSANNAKESPQESVTKLGSDDDWGEYTWGGVAEEKAPAANLIDDDFADFQSAVQPTKTTQNDLFDLLGGSIAPTQQKPIQTTPAKQEQLQNSNVGMWAQASNFVSLDSFGKTTPAAPTAVTSMNSMKNSSAQTNWNSWATNNAKPSSSAASKSSPFDDLLSL
ncbi:hypothetical protein BY458DRAFT_515719 [Sporodiniella umbellata]|nr:hypothetical protein BY458DRAFT_515719 [Sporodiniella umbellata]